MTVDSKHPLFVEFAEDWEQMRETYRGERVVKDQGFKYLPPTSGMEQDGVRSNNTKTAGWKAYVAYRIRARFPEMVKEAVESMLGVMHHKPPAIELPAKLEPLREKATLRGESLEMLLRRINQEQLTTGRVGIMLDVPEALQQKPPLPYIALYKAEHLINWDAGQRDTTEVEVLNLVVIDESSNERTENFTWEFKKKHRVLSIGDLLENEVAGVYRVTMFKDSTKLDSGENVEPGIGGRKLDKIPFEFINTKDVTAEPDEAPLLGLSNLCLTIYRGEADYRQALFLQGQDTLVTIGAAQGEDDEERRVGAGGEIALPQGSDAKYIGVDSTGLGEQRVALENDHQRGEQKAGALIEAVSRSAESGEALRVRVSARTASLNQIALAGAFGLERLLKTAAVWVGADPEQVNVTPNLDFVSDILDGKGLLDYMASKGLGAPLSLRSVHEMMAARGLTERTFEEELKEMEKEAEAGLPGSVAIGTEDEGGSTNPNGPEDEEDLDEEEEDEEEEEEETEE